MRRKLTPLQAQRFVATKNLLAVEVTRTVEFNTTADYNFGAGNWSLSFLFQCDSGNPVLIDAGDLVISITASNVEVSLLGYPVLSDPSVYPLGSLYRATIVRTATNLYLYINNRLVNSVLHANVAVDLSGITLEIGNYEGMIGELIVIKSAVSELQVGSLHETNIVPAPLHQYILSHIPFNQFSGDVAYDVVERYNYSKVAPLTKNPGLLINYAETDGHSNPVLNTVWKSIYTKERENNVFLGLDGLGQYLNIPSYSGAVVPEWTFFFSLVAPVITGTPQAFFGNDLGAPSMYFRFNTTAGQIEVFLNGIGNRLATINYTQGQEIKLLVWTDGVKSRLYTDHVNYAVPESNFTDSNFDDFIFGYNHFFGSTYQGGMGRAILVDKACDEVERRLLFNSGKTDGYRALNRLIDINMANVFLSGADYYSEDKAGYNRHALINGWTPMQPAIEMEQNTGLPALTRALKFDHAYTHHLTVSGFQPTPEKGFTYIIGMCLDSNRNFDAAYNDVFLSKRDSSNGKLKIIYGEPGGKVIHYINTSPGFFGGPMVNIKGDSSKPHFIVIQESKNDSASRPDGRAFIDGGLTRADINGGDDPTGFNSIDGDLYIGLDDTTSRSLTGYMFFYGIWKGFLTKEEINNIANNSLGQNVSSKLMTDCQLYLAFDKIVDPLGTPQIRDWSPNQYPVVMHNYTSNQLDPTDPLYTIVDLDTLR